jgi:predicted extracellular nuclease
VRPRPIALAASAALLGGLVAVPAATAATPSVVASDLALEPVNLLAHDNPWAGAFSSPADGFEIYQRDVSPSIPFALLDDSAAGFPSDSQGIIGAADTGRFFGAADTVNDDTDGPVTATWTFDVSGADGPLFLNVAAGAMGDFEATDAFEFAVGFDGATPSTVLSATVDEDGSRDYELDDGDVFTLNDPVDLAGVPLDDDLTLVNAALAGAGDTLTVTFTADTNGGDEAFAFDRLVVTQDAPLPGGWTPPPPPEPTCDAAELTAIHDVQGDGAVSPYAGSPVFTTGDPVTVRGVVTLDAPSLGGFFVQEEAGDVDDDPATSEGVFVAGSLPDGVAAGGTVEVTGGVRESFDRTQVEADEVAACRDVAPVTIAPTALTLPAGSAERETLEGMLVETAQDLYVSSLFTAYRFGELGVALDGPLTQPTAEYAPDDPRAQQLADDNADSLLFINDRDEFGNDNAPWFEDVRRRAGDVVEAGAVGALNYSFGDFLLEPVGDFPEIVQVEERPAAPELDAGNDLGAFNVLNYFNDFGDSAVLRGARSQEQFEQQTAKIVDAITRLDPAVLGLIELENDYEDLYDGDDATVPAVQDLVDALNEVAGAGTYAFVAPDADDLVSEGLGGGGLGTDAIAVGIIYQPDRATPTGNPATFDIDAELQGPDADKNRWPLAQSFEVDGDEFTLVVNHFKSKGSDCEDVDGPTFDAGDDVETELTGNCDLTRQYAARRVVDWVETKPTGVTTPDTFVVGDLNSYEEEAPVEIFVDEGYEDVVQSYGDDASTYKFDGRYGRLDHVLASPSAKRLVRDAAVWQANSAEPYGYLYYLEPVDDTAYASSDHDPVIASLQGPSRDRPAPGGGR